MVWSGAGRPTLPDGTAGAGDGAATGACFWGRARLRCRDKMTPRWGQRESSGLRAATVGRTRLGG